MTEEIRADYTKRRSERGIEFKRTESLNIKRLIENVSICQPCIMQKQEASELIKLLKEDTII